MISGQRRHEGMPPYRQMVYLLLWQTAPRVVGDAGPYGCVHRDAVKHRGAGGGAPIGATAVNEMG